MGSPVAVSDDATIRCIEAGIIPDGVLAFYPVDPIRRGRRILAFCGGTFAVAFVAQCASKVCAPLLFGLAMTLATAGIRLTPTVDDDQERWHRPTVVITATAILRLEPRGVRTWRFSELRCAQVSLQAERSDMVLVGQDGKRSFIDCGALQSGHRLIEELARTLPIEMI